jgi:hypothetical protein
MARGYRASYPEGLKSWITPDSTATPLIENITTGEAKVGSGLSPDTAADSDTIMAPSMVIAGTLTATGTINLRLGVDPVTGDADQDGNGLRVLAFELYAAPGNANVINVAPGASNPYPLFGTANDIDLAPGLPIIGCCRDNAGAAPANRLPAVAAAVKNIDVTITGSGTLYYHFVLGS